MATRVSLCSLALSALFGLGACETSPANAPAPDAGAPAKKKGELPEANFPDGPIAKVNGVEIPRKAFDTYYNRFRVSMHKQPVLYPVGGAEAVMARVTKRLVAEEVIRQEAKKAGITPPEDLVKAQLDEIQARLKRDADYAEYHRILGTTEEVFRAEAEVDALRTVLVEKIVKEANEVPKELLQATYEARKKSLEHPPQAKVGRIRFDITSGMSGDHLKLLRTRAQEVRASIKKGAKFEDAAANFSMGTSSDKGGMLGWIAASAVDPKISEVIWKTKPGQVTDVLEDDRGFYIFKVYAFRDAGVTPLEEVSPELTAELRQNRQAELITRAMSDWREGAKVEILVPELQTAMTWTSTVMPEIPEPAGGAVAPKSH
ncbi:MAG: peptidylprolyl isomerase [Deltaproteobacteria bacterium]|nr:peptidylprolyl isomerase [Deltaproteobacteria bacterium]